MRLIDIHTHKLSLVEDDARQMPYAIISHRWFPQELKYDDMSDFPNIEDGQLRDSVAKVKGACATTARWARQHYDRRRSTASLQYVWLDTVCINKKDPSELSEAINSMYRWYEGATICFVYLHDHKFEDGVKSLAKSDWFRRGWTLQELVVPSAIEFYDCNWTLIGNRESLNRELSQITGIASDILSRNGQRSIQDTSISHRMSWFSKRMTTKGEDEAYSLMGLFEVYMPAIHGEGKETASRRLQEEILKYSDDQTVFAWVSEGADRDAGDIGCGLLAPSPYCFSQSGNFVHGEMARMSDPNAEPYFMTNHGLSISLHLFNYSSEIFIASLDFLVNDKHHLGIYLRRITPAAEHYTRVYPWKLCQVKSDGRGERKRIYIRQKSR